MEAVGDEPDLCAGEADCGDTQAANGHGHQGDANLLASRQQHIHLAGWRVLGDFLGELDELVRRMPACRNHDQHLIAAVVRWIAGEPPPKSCRNPPDSFRRISEPVRARSSPGRMGQINQS